jgi:hypothetical protein
MTFVPIEKCKTLNDPGVEAAADMLGDFLDNVTAISEPGKLRPGRYRKHGFFTFFAMISELHRRSIPVPAAKASVSFRSARLLGACRRICPRPLEAACCAEYFVALRSQRYGVAPLSRLDLTKHFGSESVDVQTPTGC